MSIKTAISKFDKKLIRYLDIMVSLLLITMFLTIMVSITFRYVFNSPIIFTEESARYVMFYMVLIGASLGIRRNQHPALTFIISKFPKNILCKWNIVIDIIIFFVLIIILKEGYLMAIDEAIMKTPALRISFFWVYLAFPIGTVLMMIQIISKYIFGKNKLNG
jgi:TRAP-type transport system small permease protein